MGPSRPSEARRFARARAPRFLGALAVLCLAAPAPAAAGGAPSDSDRVATLRRLIAEARDEPERAHRLADLAEALAGEHRAEEALVAWGQAVSADPRLAARAWPQVVNLLGAATKPPPDDVIVAVVGILRRFPDADGASEAVLRLWGPAERDKFGQALLEVLRQQAAAAPDNAALWAAFGTALDGAGRYGEAADALQHAIGAGAKGAGVRGRFASCCNRAGRYAEAGATYEALAREAGDRSPMLYGQAAACFAKAGRRDEARRLLEQFLRISPQRTSRERALFHAMAASVHADLNDQDEALARYRLAMGAAADDPAFSLRRETYGWSLLAALARWGRMEEFRAEAAEMLDVMPQMRFRQRVLGRLEQALLVRGADAAATGLEEEVAALEKQPGTEGRREWRWELVARLAESEGDYARALRAWEALGALGVGRQEEVAEKTAHLREALERIGAQARALLEAPDALWKRTDPLRKDSLWIAFPNRLVVLDRRTGRRTEIAEFFGAAQWRPLCVAFEEERVWLGTDRGLFVYDREGLFWRRCLPEGDAAEARVEALEAREDAVRAVVRRGEAREVWHIDRETERWTRAE